MSTPTPVVNVEDTFPTLSTWTVYLAGSYMDREILREKAMWLGHQGIAVTASWLSSMHDGVDPILAARHDITEIESSSVFVLDMAHSPSTKGGRHVEMGYALALRIPILIVGPLERGNVFCSLVNHRISSWRSTERVAEIIRELRILGRNSPKHGT